MSYKDIQYSALIEQQSIDGEIFGDDISVTSSKKSHARALALSIASQAKTGEAACIKSSKDTAYFVSFRQYVLVVLGSSNASSPVILSFMRDVQCGLKSAQSDIPGRSKKVLEESLERIKHSRDQIDTAKSGINDVRKVMVENIDEILQRNERLGLLVDRTSQMSQSAQIFNRQAGQLERKMWYSNFKLLIISAVILTALCTAALKLL